MDESTAPLPAPTRRIPSWLVVGLLISAALGLRLFIVAQTAVAARDSVSFIRYAHGLETEPLLKVLREGQQAPGYPALVLLASWPVRAWRGDAGCDSMVLSLQSRHGPDGDAQHHPHVSPGQRNRRPKDRLDRRRHRPLPADLAADHQRRIVRGRISDSGWQRPCGSASADCDGRASGSLSAVGAAGMAYLTRPEGLEVAIAFGGVLLARQFLAAPRQPWRQVVPQALGLSLGLLDPHGSLCRRHRRAMNKNAVRSTIGQPINDPNGLLPEYGGAATGCCWPPGSRIRQDRSAAGVGGQGAGDGNGPGLRLVGIGLIVVGLATFRRRPHPSRVAALAAMVALHAVILCRMASLSGYLSERHTLLFVLAGSLPAAAGLLWIAATLPPGIGPLPGGRPCNGWLAHRVAGPDETAALQPGRAQGRRAMARQKRCRRGRHPRPFHLGRVLCRSDGHLHPHRAAGPAVRDRRKQRQPALAAAARRRRASKDRARPAGLPLARDAAARKGPGRRLRGAGERLPDPATTNPQPEYRVGIKAASPTASIRSTAPGG